MADINRCNTSVLAKNANIPACIARDIVKYRKRDAKIRDLKELWGVPGMTGEIFERIVNTCFINKTLFQATSNVPSIIVSPCLETAPSPNNQNNTSDYHILSPIAVHPSPSGRKLTAIYHRMPVYAGTTEVVHENPTNVTDQQPASNSTKVALPCSVCRPSTSVEPGNIVRHVKQKVSPTRTAIGDRRSLQDTSVGTPVSRETSRGRSRYRDIRLNNTCAAGKTNRTRRRSSKASAKRSSIPLLQSVRMAKKSTIKRKTLGKKNVTRGKHRHSSKTDGIKNTTCNAHCSKSPENIKSHLNSEIEGNDTSSSPLSKRKRSVDPTRILRDTSRNTEVIVVASVHSPPSDEKHINGSVNHDVSTVPSDEAQQHVYKHYHKEEDVLVEDPDRRRRSVMKSSKSQIVRRSLWSDKIEKVYTNHKRSRLAKKERHRRHRSGRHDRPIDVPHRLPACVLI